jgi:hypothetical protein
LDDLKEEGEVKSMYATVRRYEGVTDPTEATRRVNEGFVQLVSRIPGFVAYYWIDAGAGVMISTSVFENQASAEDSKQESRGLRSGEPCLCAPKSPANHSRRGRRAHERTRQDSNPLR